MINANGLRILTLSLLVLLVLTAVPAEAGQGAARHTVSWPVAARVAAPGASNMISDGFNAATLNTGLWSFIDPLGDATLTTNGSQVIIRMPEGVAHDAWTGANNAPRIMQPTNNTDFQLIVKIDSAMFAQYQTSGILIQENPGTYLRFDLNSDGNTVRAFAASVTNGVASAENDPNLVADSNGIVPFYLAVQRAGDNWQLAFSRNDTTYYLAANFTYAMTVTAVGVFAANQGSTPPAFTAAFDFFRGPNPEQPTLLLPAAGAFDLPVTTRLVWEEFDGASSYRVQLATSPSFTSGVVLDDSTVADSTREVSGLTYGGTYYWRVAAQNSSGGRSAYSATRSFTIVAPPPGTPTPVAPAPGAVNVAVTPEIRWNRSVGATTYWLQVGTDSAFVGGLALNDTTVADTVRAVTGLSHVTLYYWRVAAKGPSGVSAFSPVRSFTTVISPPGTPSLVSPAQATGNLPLPVTFAWTRRATATAYQLQVTPDSLFISSLAVNDSTITDSVKTVTVLEAGTKYFWRVRAMNAGGGSPFTAARSLVTAIGAPTLLAPLNNDRTQPLTVTFRWKGNPTATGYRLQLATDSTFATGVLKNDSTITDTSRVIGGLVINTRYFWRIQARDDFGAGPFTATWVFTTATPLADQVVVLAPAHQAELGSDTVTFLWQRSQPLVNRYWLEYAADSLFIFRIVDSTLADTTKAVGGLLKETRYFWHVRAGNPGGWGPYSPTRTFTLGPNGVDTDKELPTAFALGQNYPNPFNPQTVIEFALPAGGRVVLEVYSMLGERIATLVNDVRPAGRHQVSFHAGRHPSGMYLYRLTVDGVVRDGVRRMLLVK